MGRGKLQKPDGTSFQGYFEGSFFANGFGIYKFQDFEQVGNFKGLKLEGFAHNKEAYGDVQTGFFKNGQLDGFGSTEFLNGTKYIGENKGDKANGQGLLMSPEGAYFGDLVDQLFKWHRDFNIYKDMCNVPLICSLRTI